MTAQTNPQRLLYGRNDAVEQLFLTFSVTTTSLSGTTTSVNYTFPRAFAVAAAGLANPKVIGTNSDTVGATVNVIANATSMSVYLRGGSPTMLTDGTAVVTVTIEGGY